MKRGAKYGSIAGIVAWITGGFAVGLHVGGFGAIMLLSKLSGGPIESTLLTRLFVICGMVTGVICTGTAAIVVGALLGALVGTTIERTMELTHAHTV